MEDRRSVEMDSHRVSRRTLMKAGAVAGGAAWVAPTVLESFASPAAAASAPPTSEPCVYLLSISYIALIVEGPSGVYSLVKINYNETTAGAITSVTVTQGNKQALPCGGKNSDLVPPYTSLTGTATVTLVSYTATSVTFKVAAGDTVLWYGAHGKNPNGIGSSCVSGMYSPGLTAGEYTIALCPLA